MTPPKSDYPVVRYLNQRYVLDVLSMMEGGFSYIESVRARQSDQGESSGRVGGEVGLANVFALLGVKLAADVGSRESSTLDRESTVEKVHTPNSLFARLRQRLYSEQMVHTELVGRKAGEFVEFRAVFSRSPLLETLEVLRSIGSLVIAFSGGAQNSENKRKAKGNQGDKSSVSPQVMKQIDALVGELKTSGMIDLVGHPTENKDVTVIASAESVFLSDPTLSDIVDGEFTVLGKTTRCVYPPSEESIRLLRNSSLGKITHSEFWTAMQEISTQASTGIDLPKLDLVTKPPFIQMIPIAIFA